MVKFQKLENIIKLFDDEFIYKYYQAFKYSNKHHDLYVVITNKRLILLSLNMKNHSQVKIEEYPLSIINKFTIEYGQIVQTKRIVTFCLLLVIGLISMSYLIYTLFNFSWVGLIVSIIMLFLSVFSSVFVFLKRKISIFFFEVYNKFQNQKIISITSNNYRSPFSKTNYFKISQDTFLMLSEISVVISQAKKLTKEPVITLEEKPDPVQKEQLNLVI